MASKVSIELVTYQIALTGNLEYDAIREKIGFRLAKKRGQRLSLELRIVLRVLLAYTGL